MARFYRPGSIPLASFAWLPKTRASGLSRRLAAHVTPVVVFLLNYLHPIFKKLDKLPKGSKKPTNHSGLYDRQDLIDLINNQKQQADNRIRLEDLELVKRGLKLADKTVADYCQNWSKIQHVKSDESVGPVLLNDLHKSGQQFVPVVDVNEPKQVVGLINLASIDISSNARLADLMSRTVHYLNEADSLEDALAAMTDTSQPAYMVRDKKDRLFGMITLKDVMGQLFDFKVKPKDYVIDQDAHDEADKPDTSEQVK